jgi:hypothetical protein
LAAEIVTCAAAAIIVAPRDKFTAAATAATAAAICL